MSDDLTILGRKDENRRLALVREYGPQLVRQAEFDVLVGILISSGMFSKDQFLDYVAQFLAKEDAVRRVAAGFKD
jgi:hypothetical protein